MYFMLLDSYSSMKFSFDVKIIFLHVFNKLIVLKKKETDGLKLIIYNKKMYLKSSCEIKKIDYVLITQY